LLDVGESNAHNIHYHVSKLVESGILMQTHAVVRRGSLEKLYVVAADSR
jgi:hypothetical protein